MQVKKKKSCVKGRKRGQTGKQSGNNKDSSVVLFSLFFFFIHHSTPPGKKIASYPWITVPHSTLPPSFAGARRTGKAFDLISRAAVVVVVVFEFFVLSRPHTEDLNNKLTKDNLVQASKKKKVCRTNLQGNSTPVGLLPSRGVNLCSHDQKQQRHDNWQQPTTL